MTIKDELKASRESLKGAPFKKKLSYFWDYYKWHTIGTAAVIVLIIAFIAIGTSNRETLFYGIFLNSMAYEDQIEVFGDDYVTDCGLDAEKYEAVIDVTLYMDEESLDSGLNTSIQKLSVFSATSQMDVLGGPLSAMNICIYDSYFYDLRTVLSEEQQESFEPYFLYVDEAIVEEKRAAETSSKTYEFTYPDPTKPEEMASPVPVAIDVSSSEKLQQLYEDNDEMLAIGIAIGTERMEQAVDFIEYLFEE